MYAYTIIRKDLPIQHQLVQACHSALEAGSEFKSPGNIPHLILLQCENEDHLHEISDYLHSQDIRFHKFFEPDNGMGYSSITTEPLPLERKSLMSQYSLWRAA